MGQEWAWAYICLAPSGGDEKQLYSIRLIIDYSVSQCAVPMSEVGGMYDPGLPTE